MKHILYFFLFDLKGAKKGLSLLLLLFLAVFSLSGVILVPGEVNAAEYRVNAADVHFRAAPGMDAEILGGLPCLYTFFSDEKVTDPEGHQWYALTYDGSPGYVSADCVEEISEPEPADDTEPAEEPAEEGDYLLIPEEETLQTEETETLLPDTEITDEPEVSEPSAEDPTEAADPEISGDDEDDTGLNLTDTYESEQAEETVEETLAVARQPGWSGVVQSEAEFEAQLAAFPESYKAGLRQVHEVYPNYRFTADYVGMDFQQVVDAEAVKKVSAYSSPSMKAMYDASFGYYENYNWDTGEWYNSEGLFTFASREVIEYYMDPRNFLDPLNIYMFMRQSYTGNESLDGVRSIIEGTFLSKGYIPNRNEPNDVRLNGDYAAVILEAGRNSAMSPYALAASILVEHGYYGETPLISGYYKAYDGTEYIDYYNFFDIGATGTDSNNVIQNGLEYAKSMGWISRYLSIVNGAAWTVDGYISNGQDTYYYKEWNVVNGWNSLWHQFSTGVMSSWGSAYVMRSALSGNTYATLDFRIPVYENMSAEPPAKPEDSDKLNNYYFTDMHATGLTPAFSMANREYTMTVTGDTTLRIAVPKWAIYESAYAFYLYPGENLISLDVRSQTGYLRTYRITVTSAVNCIMYISAEEGNRLAISDNSSTIWGDANGDGQVSSLDYITIKNHIMGIGFITGSGQITAADTNGDGMITSLDYIAIKNYIMSK